MTEGELRDEIRSLLVETLMLSIPATELTDDRALFGPGSVGLDSVDALQLVVALDKRYGLKISDAAVARQVLASVTSIADAVSRHRAGDPGFRSGTEREATEASLP